MYQGPRLLQAVFLASVGRTPIAKRAARRRRGVFHCRQSAARRRARTRQVSDPRTRGVSQKPKVAAPTPHIRGQFLHGRFDADALCTSCDLPDSPLKTDQGFWRDCSLNLWSVCKAESEELPLLRSGHRTLRLVHFELELLRDELRDALHHSLGLLLDVRIVSVENRNCDRKTSGPTAAAEPASPLAEEIDRASLCDYLLAWKFLPLLSGTARIKPR